MQKQKLEMELELRLAQRLSRRLVLSPRVVPLQLRLLLKLQRRVKLLPLLRVTMGVEVAVRVRLRVKRKLLVARGVPPMQSRCTRREMAVSSRRVRLTGREQGRPAVRQQESCKGTKTEGRWRALHWRHWKCPRSREWR